MPAVTRSKVAARKPAPAAKARAKAGAKQAATKQAGGARRSGSGRSGGAAGRRPASTPRQPGLARRVARGVADDHAVDLFGIALIALGILVALGVWFHTGGPVGRSFETVSRAAVGRVAWWLPVVLAVAGVVLCAARFPHHGAQRALGWTVTLWALLALLQLFGGQVSFSAPMTAFSTHGGYVGGLLAVPLSAALGTVGAGVVCCAFLMIGLLVATGQTLRSVGAVLQKVFVTTVATGRDDRDDPDELRGQERGTGKFRVVADAQLYDQAGDTAGQEAVPPQAARPETPSGTPGRKDTPPVSRRDGQAIGPKAPPRQLHLDVPQPPDAAVYELPDASFLRKSTVRTPDHASLEERAAIIGETLREFRVGARLVGIVAGPTVTRYEIELDQGVKVTQLTKLGLDLCVALATPDVRIIAPIPGRSAIGLEVPNAVRQLVTVGDILESPEAKAARHPLEVALGRDIAGKAMLVNLAEMPHLLIAGATGSGKSSCINSILTSLLSRTRPSEVRMILVDPKRVELGRYGRVPHLLTGVVTQPKKAAEALEWVVQEMERRYELLASAGARDVVSFNQSVDRGELSMPLPGIPEDTTPERLPYIVVVVDELADLMLVAARNVEDAICRLAQMARAVGIHLVIATQRPSVDVITGVIKANIPSRMAFKVRTVTDSRVILDQGGAEKLVGQGDLLYLAATASVTERIQTCFVTEGEVAKIVQHWRGQLERVHGVVEERAVTPAVPVALTAVEAIETFETFEAGAAGVGAVPPRPETFEPDVVFSGDHAVRTLDADDDSDELLGEAMELVVRSQLGSTSMLQRKLRVGFARAGRIMDLLERRGIVGPSEGSKARAVLISPGELGDTRHRLGL